MRIVPLKKIPGEPGTISAKPEYVYQTQLRKRVIEKQSANRDMTKSVQQWTAQTNKKRFGQRTLRRNNEYKKNVQLPESP
jgi:hypothetical protein